MKEYLCFSAIQDLLVGFMRDRKSVILSYQTPEGIILSRYVYPYVLGYTSAGNLAVRVFQTTGGTRSEQGWKILRLDRIVDIKAYGEIPAIPPAGYNPAGDRGLKSIIYKTPEKNEVKSVSPITPVQDIVSGIKTLKDWIKKLKEK